MASAHDYRCSACGALSASTLCRACCRRSSEGEQPESLDTGRRAAGRVINYAVDRGFPSPSRFACVDCGDQASDYDHRDYNKPWAVEPVCAACNTLRGPAIPLHGAVAAMVALGAMPYRHKAKAEQLFRILGKPVDALSGFPRVLTIKHWRELLPHFALSAPQPAQPATSTEGA